MANKFSNANRLVTVFGGSGFVGRHVVHALAARGWRVRVACRRPDLAYFLQPLGGVGQITAIQANLRHPRSVAGAIRGSDAVINLVGLLFEKGQQNFSAVHQSGAAAVAEAAAAEGVTSLVHMSALGAAAGSDSVYASTKAAGEATVLAAAPSAVIIRPSVVFGPEDSFFNRFAAMTRYTMVLPLVGGETLFQPVYVGDVAQAIANALDGHARPGAVYELGGPEAASFRALVEWICKTIDRKRLIVDLPVKIGHAMAHTTEILSKASLGLYPEMLMTTRDQIALLAQDNVVSPQAIADHRTLRDLGVEPESFRAIVPSYLWRYRRAGQFDSKRLA